MSDQNKGVNFQRIPGMSFPFSRPLPPIPAKNSDPPNVVVARAKIYYRNRPVPSFLNSARQGFGLAVFFAVAPEETGLPKPGLPKPHVRQPSRGRDGWETICRNTIKNGGREPVLFLRLRFLRDKRKKARGVRFGAAPTGDTKLDGQHGRLRLFLRMRNKNLFSRQKSLKNTLKF
ncbi:MAG: hypothetical protein LBP95_09915 [Deltaproteobacteria bacterium]|jgi:hypothetical protein|nr:hypothetical protein [Deltaproteobacteria bacterium]